MNFKIGLIIGFLIILAIGVFFIFPKPQISPISPISQISPTPSSVSYTPPQVAEHNNPNDCWLIISGQVYNATSYLLSHPGGAEKIIPFCGQDATQAFSTQGGQGTHSTLASNLLSDFLIGSLSPL